MTGLQPDRSTRSVHARLAALPGVEEVVAVPRYRLRSQPAPAVAAHPAAFVGGASPDPAGTEPAALDGGPLVLPVGAPATLQEALRRAAREHPDHGTRYVVAGEPDSWQSYPQLLAQAQRVLDGLRAAGLRPGDAALFVLEDNRAFITAFWACVLGGFVPTPVAVAPGYDAPNEANRKLHGAWELLHRPVLLTDPATAPALAGVRTLWDEPGVRILTVTDLLTHEPDRDWFDGGSDTPVLNLLTSGSTGVPKCVQHTNASVLARSHAVIEHCGLDSQDVTFIWMPLDHVTVAMYNVRDVVAGATHVNARSADVLGDVLGWLDAMDRYRVTSTWAPNFAFAMVVERSAELADRALDLSCVREMTNAGEPVIAATSRRFLELLRPHGLRPDVMVPVWGMSETCSGVTYTRQSIEDPAAGTVSLDPAHLQGTVRLLDGPGAAVVSSVGRPIPGVRLRVVGPDGAVLRELQVGELEITGATMMAGYFGNPEAQREAWTADGWFRTGDLAFVHAGEVAIVGRSKDQVIIRGINYLAHELENVAGATPGLRLTFTAAAGVRDPGDDSDRLIVFFVPQAGVTDLTALTDAVRDRLVREAGVAPDLLVPVTQAEFRKTSSGKIQRAAMVAQWREGRFDGRVIDARAAAASGPTLARRRWTDCEVAAPIPLREPVLLVAPRDLAAALDPDQRWGRTEDAADTARAGTLVWAEPVEALADPFEPRHAVRCAGRLAALGARLSALLAGSDADLLVLTAGGLGAAGPAHPGATALAAAVRSAAAEAEGRTVRLADLPADRSGWPAALREELSAAGPAVVGYRDGRRLRPALEPVALPPADGRPAFVPGGRYLVTGGLGGVAGTVVDHLLDPVGARVLIVGRRRPDAARRARLRALAERGEVVYRAVDVADAAGLAAAVAAVEADWGGRLDGVVHLAGADPTSGGAGGEIRPVDRTRETDYAVQLRSKVAGTLALLELLARRPGATLLLNGSVNGEFGGHGFGAYAMANGFLQGVSGAHVRTVAWSMWPDTGMSATLSEQAARRRGFDGIDADAGRRLIDAAMRLPAGVVLAGVDLAHPAVLPDTAPEFLELDHVLLAVAGTPDPAAVHAVVDAATAEPGHTRVAVVAAIARRPDGAVDATAVVADAALSGQACASEGPRGPVEVRLAGIWSQALARPVAARDQSFFELGGDSLRAARLLAMVARDFGVRLATRDLYAGPTVADMATLVGSPAH